MKPTSRLIVDFKLPKRGLEPPLDCSNQPLKLARLPIPPLRLKMNHEYAKT